MSKRILFEELVARREQREADKLKIGELRIPDSDRTLEAKMPPKKAVLELYGELAAAQDAAAALQCGNHALYAVCPQRRTGISRGRSARRRTPCAPWTSCFP